MPGVRPRARGATRARAILVRWRRCGPPTTTTPGARRPGGPRRTSPSCAGPVLDASCGEGRLRHALGREVAWVGLDASPAQKGNPYHPLTCGDMQRLPFAYATFAEVTHLWCLYHLNDPVTAICEAARVLRPGGRYYACCAARTSDPELLQGYPPTTFDAEEAVGIVASVFGAAEGSAGTGRSSRSRPLTRCAASAVTCPSRPNAEGVALPLWSTKRGVLVRATKV